MLISLCVTVTKILDKNILEEKFIWLMVPELQFIFGHVHCSGSKRGRVMAEGCGGGALFLSWQLGGRPRGRGCREDEPFLGTP